MLGACLFSTTIEFLQNFLTGRDSTLGDVVFNAAGAALGFLAVLTWRIWLVPTGATRNRFWAAASAGALVVLAATALLVQPNFPNEPYYAQWTPQFENVERYQGRIRAASIGSHDLPNGLIDAATNVRTQLLAGNTLRVLVVAGQRTRSFSPIFNLFDAEEREIVSIGAHRTSLVLRYRTSSVSFRLDQPIVHLAGYLSDVQTGELLDIRVQRHERGFCVGINDHAQCPAGFTLGSGWRILFSGEGLRPLHAALQFIWLALLFLPAGLWSPGWRSLLTTGAAAVAALVALPPLLNVLATSWTELSAALIGLAAGHALARWIIRIARPWQRGH